MVDNQRGDEAYSVFFEQECRVLLNKVIKTIYDKNEALQYIPLAPAEGPGVETIAWRKQTAVGQAKIIADYATDIPSVDVYGEEEQSKVYQIAITHGWNKKEIEKAMREGKPLREDRLNAARQAIEAKVDKLAWFGDAKYNIPGFVNYPGITLHTFANGAEGHKKWETKTPAEIAQDIIDMVDSITEVTHNNEHPNTCLMPPKLYRLLTTKFVDTDMRQTVLELVQKTNPTITKWAAVQALEHAGADGAQRIIIYDNSSDKLAFHLPVAYNQLEPERNGLRWDVISMADVGGTTVYYPLSVIYADNKE